MPDDDALQMVRKIQDKVDEAMGRVAELKKAANVLAVALGVEAPYADVAVAGTSSGQLRYRADQFTNHDAPSSAAHAYLKLRGPERGAASAEEIHDALEKGGYFFEAKEIGALKIALSKDKRIFRVPNGSYGLKDWYPKAPDLKHGKRVKGASEAAGPEAGGTGEEEGEPEAGSESSGGTSGGAPP